MPEVTCLPSHLEFATTEKPAEDKKKNSKKNKKQSKKESSSSKSSEKKRLPVWQHEWTLPKLLVSNGNIGVHQIVQGPFSTPRLIRASPWIIDRHPVEDENSRRKTGSIRRGIPDPWNEYVALRGFCSENDRRTVKRHLRLGCDSVRLTEAVWTELGISLAQGIPDPWKESPYETGNLIKKRKARPRQKKSRIKLRGSSGDREIFGGPSIKIEDKFSKERKSRMNGEPAIPDEKGGKPGIKSNIEKEAKKNRTSGNSQTVFFDVAEDQRVGSDDEKNLTKKRRRDFLERQCRRTVTNVRHGQTPNRLSCEIGVARRKSNSFMEKSNDHGVCRDRSRIIEVSRTSETLWDERKPSYPCRVCQPEVTPTRCSSAATLRQENFWRCTRHQPGASCRVVASRVCGRREVLENEEPFGTTNFEPTTIRQRCNGRHPEKEKTVAGMMRRLLRGWNDKSEVREDETYWNPNDDERSGDINLVCCRCSCPYLVTAPPRGRERYYRDTGAATTRLCERCLCCRCLNRRERRMTSRKSVNCLPHCQRVKHKSAKKRKTNGSVKKLRVCEVAQVLDNAGVESSGKNEAVPDDKEFEKKSSDDKIVESATQTEDRSGKTAKVESYGIRAFLKSSTDSGERADVSDASKRTDTSAMLASATSSTFIKLMNEKPDQLRVMKERDRGHDSRDETEPVESPRRRGRRPKRRFRCFDRSTNRDACRCLDTGGKSEFKGYDESILETKRVTYGSTEESLAVEGALSLPEETSRIRRKADTLETSSNEETPARIDGQRHLTESFSRAGRISSLEDLSKTDRQAEVRSISDVQRPRRNRLAKRNVPESRVDESDQEIKNGGTSADRRNRVQTTFLERKPSVAFPVLQTGKWANSEVFSKARDGIPTKADRSESHFKESRGTDMVGVKLSPGPCVETLIDFNEFQGNRKMSTTPTPVREFLGPSDEAVESYVSDSAGFRDRNDDHNLKSADASKRFTMVEPFAIGASEADADTISTDDSEIENLDLKVENVASSGNRENSAINLSIPETAMFLRNEQKDDADKCYAKYCAERKSGIPARYNEELILQSLSENEK